MTKRFPSKRPMAVAKTLTGLLAVILMTATAWAHRVPEAYVTLEEAEIDGSTVTALTVKLEAYDAFALAQALTGKQKVSLSSADVLQSVGEQVAAGVTLSTGGATYVGSETSGEEVYIYLTGSAGSTVSDAKILSSIYRQWTNYVDDQRGIGFETQVFRQNEALPNRHGLGHQH